MLNNPIRWVSVAPNYSGAQRVMICRKDKQGDMSASLPIYKPTPASLARMLTLIEDRSENYVISISCGSLTGRMSIILHNNLKRLAADV